MFGFLTRQDLEKEIALPFKVVLEAQDDGFFVAKVPSLSGCTARGRSKSEALKNVEEAVRLHLDASASAPFDIVWEDASQPVVHSLAAFSGRLVAGSNRDGSLVSQSGDLGAWVTGVVSSVSQSDEESFRLRREAVELEGGEGKIDYTPQVYCLAAYGGSGVHKLYAGTSNVGSVYESVDGVHWDLSTATGEARVHCLVEFKGRLYAGSSPNGKLFCYTGAQWSQVHRSPEVAVTAACAFRDELFIGTYPGGHIYASSDGVYWHLAYDSGQTFIRSMVEFDGHLYAAASKNSGGTVFRSSDGLRWQKVFESKDPNFYGLLVFHHALWLGTGNHGRLYKSLDGERWQLAASLEDEGIRALAAYQGRLYLATEGRGRIYRSRFADTPPPSLYDMRVHGITSHSAVVSWRTDRPCDSRAFYGLESLDDSVHASAAVTEHRLALSNLRSQSAYRLKLVSRSPDGSEAGFSDELSFSTGGAETALLSSPSHPAAGWSRQADAQLSWSVPEGVVRFHHCVDRVPDTLPEPGVPGVRSGGERSAQLPGLADGIWWFHLRCEDRAGNLGTEASHYCLRVDTQALPPRLSSPTHPVDGAWSNKAKAGFVWEPPADLSGIAGYCVLLDRHPSTVPGHDTGVWTQEPRFQAELAEDGEWWFHAVSVDAVGNVGQQAAHYSLKLDRRADPPSVESPSHPDSSRWYNTSQMRLNWSPPADRSGVTGYYTVLDQRPDTVPTAHTGIFTLAQSAAYAGKGDGAWWFHIISVDAAGNVGTEAAHHCLRVDTWAAPPEVVSPTHPAGAWVASGHVSFDLNPPEDLSGTVGYYWLLDKERLTLPSADKGTFTAARTVEFNDLADGLWILHVVSKDSAGNVGVEVAHCAVRVDTEALPPRVTSSTHPDQEEWNRQRSAVMAWETPEDLSGIACYHWLLDQSPDSVPTPHSGARVAESRVRVEMPEDGVWYFHVVSQDRAGNISREAGHYRLKVDSVALPPRLLCPTHPDKAAWSNHTQPRFEWLEPEDSSGVAGYYWSLDRSPETVLSPSATYTTERYAVVDRGIEGDGIWWFHVTSRDRAGNVGQEASHWSVRIDTQALPPAVSSPTHPDRDAWSNNTRPRFEWPQPEDSSGVVGYYWCLDRNPDTVPNAAGGIYTTERRAILDRSLEGDGTWWFHVTSRDRAGNVGLEASHWPLRIDTQALPPVINSSTHPEGAWTRNAGPSFAWTPPRDASGVAGYYYMLDHEPRAVPTRDTGQFTTETSVGFSRVEDGIWYLHVVTLDNAGNLGDRAAHYGIQIDTLAEAPRLASSTHPEQDKWRCNAEPILQWSPPADPSGVAGYYWCVDQLLGTVPGPQSRWTTETQAAPGPLPDGEWWFHVVTKDGAGNLSNEAAHYRLRIDTRAPTPKLYCRSHPDPAAWMAEPCPSLVWEDGEDHSGVIGHYWIFDRNPLAPVVPDQANWSTAGGLSMPPQKDGTWTFALVAKDLAGNLSDPARLTLRIETQAPTSRLEPLPELTGRADIQLRWHAEDRVSGVAHHDLQVREGAQGEWRDWLRETSDNSGRYSARDGADLCFRVRATDRAGNVEAWPEEGAWVRTLVDLSPPEPVLSLEARPGPAGCVLLSWSPVVDEVSGMAVYEVWRSAGSQEEGIRISPEGGVAQTSFTDPGLGLDDGALYYYSVVPVDKAGNRRTEGNQRVSSLCDRSALPPVLASSTHPEPLEWSRSTRALVQWEHPPDGTGITGYYWILDQSLGTIPDPLKAKFTEKSELEITGLKDGTWYLHVITKDRAGNLSAVAAHYQFNVDTTPPPAPSVRCVSHPNPEAWTHERTATFQWTVPPDPAKIAGYYWLVDASPVTLPRPGHGQYSEAITATVSGLEDGIWFFHVAAVDRAGNAGRDAGHARLQVTHTPPPPKVSSSTHPRPGESFGSRKAVFHWSTPSYSEPINGWYYCLDQSPDTVPDARHTRSSDLRAEFNGLAEGDWYFHVVSAGASGRLGRLAEHYWITVRVSACLEGQVTKPNGILPQEGAGLELYRNGKSLAKTVTSKEGRYRFDETEPGEYLLKLDIPGSPPLLLEEIKLEGGDLTLNLSAEVMAWPSPTQGAAQVRFAVLAKEPGQLQIKLYNEAGQAVGQVEGTVARLGYAKLSWDSSQAAEGAVLWQATLTGGGGKVVKYPIRKLQITR